MSVFWIIIVASIIGGSLFGYLKGFSDKGLKDAALGLVLGLGGGAALAIVICWLLSEIFPGKPAFYDAPDKPARILNLEDSKETKLDGNGAFILVAGGFSLHEDTERTYSFYQETPDGSYFLHTISADHNTLIRIYFIADNEVPHAIRRQPEPHWISADWISPIDLSPDNPASESASEIWTLYVPKGTISTVDRFKLDGE